MSAECKILDDLWRGVANGWWESVDADAKLPVRVFNRSDFHETATWAHVWHRVGKFGSVKEAKRAGFGNKLDCGTQRLGTWIVHVRPDAIKSQLTPEDRAYLKGQTNADS